MKRSPTALTIEAIEAQGGMADVVERFIPGAKIRRDLFGFIDIVAINGSNLAGIQVTDSTSYSKRDKKIRKQCRDAALAWLHTGNSIELWAWREKDGGYVPRIHIYGMADFKGD